MTVIVVRFTFESSSASELHLPATYPHIHVDHLGIIQKGGPCL